MLLNASTVNSPVVNGSADRAIFYLYALLEGASSVIDGVLVPFTGDSNNTLSNASFSSTGVLSIGGVSALALEGASLFMLPKYRITKNQHSTSSRIVPH